MKGGQMWIGVRRRGLKKDSHYLHHQHQHHHQREHGHHHDYVAMSAGAEGRFSPSVQSALVHLGDR